MPFKSDIGNVFKTFFLKVQSHKSFFLKFTIYLKGFTPTHPTLVTFPQKGE